MSVSGLGSQPWGDGKQFRRPWERGGSVRLVADVGFTQIKKQIPISSKFLSVRWRLLDMCMRLCRSTRAEFVYSCVKVCGRKTC